MPVGHEEFPITCFSIGLGGFDLVLGANYLRTLGTILLDLDSLRMAFQWRGWRVFWRGLGAPHLEGPEAHAHSVYADPDRPFIDDLLQEYDNVFAEPHGLPPSRPYDHRIHLLPGTTPVAVRPYRYPQLQKDELERSVPPCWHKASSGRAHRRSLHGCCLSRKTTTRGAFASTTAPSTTRRQRTSSRSRWSTSSWHVLLH
jgi:hypothetical protein